MGRIFCCPLYPVAPNDAYPVLQGAGVYFQMMQLIMAIIVQPFLRFFFSHLLYFFFVRYLKKKINSYNLNWGFADCNKNLIHVPKS
jgi:hypothetical protein